MLMFVVSLFLQTPALWYLLLRASSLFQESRGRWPGQHTTTTTHLESDADDLLQFANTLCEFYQLPTITCDEADNEQQQQSGGESNASVRRDHAEEVVRYGGSELHATSAVIGGIAAQEAVKILTHQYTPMISTYVYNGIAGCGAVLGI